MDWQVTVRWSGERHKVDMNQPHEEKNVDLHNQFVEQERIVTGEFLAVQRDLHEEVAEAAIAFSDDPKLTPLLAILVDTNIPEPSWPDGPPTDESIDQRAQELRKAISPTIVKRLKVPYENVLEEMGNQLGLDNHTWSEDGGIVK